MRIGILIFAAALSVAALSVPASAAEDPVERVTVQHEPRAEAPPIPPVLSSPRDVVLPSAAQVPQEATFFPPGLVPWALFFTFFAFTVVVGFQHWILSSEAGRLGFRPARHSPEWRLMSIFTAALAAMTMIQLGYAAYASAAFFQTLARAPSFLWLVFLCGFLPLPVLLIEALCTVRHPGLGATRHYYNNVRLSEGRDRWLARGLERLEDWHRHCAVTRFPGAMPVRWGLALARLFLVYILATVWLGLHVRRTKGRYLEARPYRAWGQLAMDLHILLVVILALFGLGFGLLGMDPATGPMLLGVRVTGTMVIRGYLVSLGVTALLIAWLALPSDDTDSFARGSIGRLGMLAALAVLGLIAADIWISTLPLSRRLPSWEDLPQGVSLLGLVRELGKVSYSMRQLVGGWAPPGFAVATLVLAVMHQRAIGRIWQTLGVNAGQRLPFGFMLKVRHRGLNLLGPIKLALSEAQILAASPGQSDPQLVARLLERGQESCGRMEFWFDDIRKGAAALDWAFTGESSGQWVALSDILTQLQDSIRSFILVENRQGIIPPENVTMSISNDLKGAKLDINAASLHDCLSNIAHNACEAIWSQPQQDNFVGFVSILARAQDDPLYPLALVIEDNGPGIAPSLRQRVFDPLFSHGKDKGTGMGLYQAQAFMRSIGSDVSIRVSASGGCSVVLPFPIDLLVIPTQREVPA
jgi:signal transduction histidine kinase